MDQDQLNEIRKKLDPDRHKDVKLIGKKMKNLDHHLKDIYNKVDFDKYKNYSELDDITKKRYVIDTVDSIIYKDLDAERENRNRLDADIKKWAKTNMIPHNI